MLACEGREREKKDVHRVCLARLVGKDWRRSEIVAVEIGRVAVVGIAAAARLVISERWKRRRGRWLTWPCAGG